MSPKTQQKTEILSVASLQMKTLLTLLYAGLLTIICWGPEILWEECT